MYKLTPWASLLLLAFLFLPTKEVSAGPVPAPQAFPVEDYRWAFGRIIDSVAVEGNSRVHEMAVLRELESREGERLDVESLERDLRFINDLGVFATVDIHLEPVGSEAVALRVVVTERPLFLLNLVYPILEYDVNSKRVRYGVKWHDRNFRRRLENFSVDFKRDGHRNDNASIGWSTPWIGWRHISIGARASYFHLEDEVNDVSVVEQSAASTWISYPLTESRIRFVSVLGGLSTRRNRLQSQNGPEGTDVFLAPSIGFYYDSRDSRLKPAHGSYFLTNIEAPRKVNDGGGQHYRLVNVVRSFHSMASHSLVLGVYSNLVTQLDDYPVYTRFGLGGSGTLRGWESDVLRGAHRWIQTAELRFYPWPKRVYRWPFVGAVDFTLAFVGFLDSGIAWTAHDEFKSRRFHGGGGFGLRLYSPLQDVVRFDVGFDAHGNVRQYLSTGVRF